MGVADSSLVSQWCGCWGCSRSSQGAGDAESSSKMQLFQKFSQRCEWCWKLLKDAAVPEVLSKGRVMLEVPQRWGCSRSSLKGAGDAGSSSKMRLFQKFSQRGWWCWKFLKDVAVPKEFLKGAAAPCTSRKKIKFCSSLRVRLHLFLLSTGAAAPCTPLTLSKLSIFLSLQTALLTLRMMRPSIFRMLRLLLLQDSARSVSTRLPECGWISGESTNSHVFPFQNNRSLSSVKNSQSSSFLTFLSSPRMALSHAIKTSLSLIPKQQPRDPSSKMLSLFPSLDELSSFMHPPPAVNFFFLLMFASFLFQTTSLCL